jgi:hypothetical protein
MLFVYILPFFCPFFLSFLCCCDCRLFASPRLLRFANQGKYSTLVGSEVCRCVSPSCDVIVHVVPVHVFVLLLVVVVVVVVVVLVVVVVAVLVVVLRSCFFVVVRSFVLFFFLSFFFFGLWCYASSASSPCCVCRFRRAPRASALLIF